MSLFTKHSKRWLEYDDLREARNMSTADVLKRSDALRNKAMREFSKKTIKIWGLDNPYAQDLAIKIMRNESVKARNHAAKMRQYGIARGERVPRKAGRKDSST